jgi:selT/selW/selH-like putative selenoprotein
VKAWIEARGCGPVDVRPGKSGQFDIIVNGKLVYSRYETGRFPSDSDLDKIQF